METIYLVIAQWEFEGSEELVAFRKKEEAEAFSDECAKYQKTENDDDSREWLDQHPARKFLKPGAHLFGVEGYPVLEITVL